MKLVFARWLNRHLAWLVALAGLLSACSSPTGPQLGARGAPTPTGPPVRPRTDEPVDVLEFHRYLETQALALLHQNQLVTNLSIQTAPTRCRLALAQPSNRLLSPPDLAQSTVMAVAVVGTLNKSHHAVSLDGVATGFFLTDSGALVTCFHVFQEPKTLSVVAMTRDGRVCPVQSILSADPTNDLIVVQVEGRGFSTLPVAPTARQGASVCVLSHPEWRFYTLTRGIVSAYTRWPREEGPGQRLWMSITADFAVGSSGAPVLDETGAVVGIAAETVAIYPTDKADQAQMVEKLCVPSARLLDLVGAP